MSKEVDINNKKKFARIQCIYTFDNKVNEKNCWRGYIIFDENDNFIELKGYEIDQMDDHERDGSHHIRYIRGKINNLNGNLQMEIYPQNIAPILYDMYYDKDDNVYYGYWNFFISSNHPNLYFGGGQAAMLIDYSLSLEEQNQEKNIINKIEYTSQKLEKEYTSEIRIIDNINNLIPINELDTIINELDTIKTPLIKELVRTNKNIFDKK